MRTSSSSRTSVTRRFVTTAQRRVEPAVRRASGDGRRPAPAADGTPVANGDAAAPTVDADGGFDAYRPLADLPPRSLTIIALERAGRWLTRRRGRETRSSTRSSRTGSRRASESRSPARSSRGTRRPTHYGYKGGDLLGLAERLDELADLGITGALPEPDLHGRLEPPLQRLRLLARSTRCSAATRRCASSSTRPMRGTSESCSTGCSTTSGAGSGRSITSSRSGGASPYRDWFYLDPSVARRAARARMPTASLAAGRTASAGYRSWWDVPSLPKLRVENPAVREFLLRGRGALAPVRDRRLAAGRSPGRRGPDVLAGVPPPRPGGQSRGLPRRRDLGRGARSGWPATASTR